MVVVSQDGLADAESPGSGLNQDGLVRSVAQRLPLINHFQGKGGKMKMLGCVVLVG